MSESSAGVRRHGWKVLGCGLAVLGMMLAGAPAGAASPTKPGAPTNVSATPGVRSAKVSFTKPANNGGAPITNYRAVCTSSNGGSKSAHEGSKSPIFVAGLTAGKTYTCTVAARNRVGLGPASGQSNPFVPLAAKPGAPTNVSATPGVRSAKVSFTKPADNGGAPITNYRAVCTSSNGGAKGSHEGPKSPIVVNGLTAGKTYTCTVAARNRVGLGPASAPSNTVVPLAG